MRKDSLFILTIMLTLT